MKIHFNSTISAATVFILGIACTGTLSIVMMHHNNASIDQAAAEVLSTTESKIADRLQRYEYGLRGARGALITAGEQNINPALFKNYMLTRDLEQEFPGARGFGFIRKVPEQQQEQYLQKIRLDIENFNIRQLSPHEGDRYIIEIVEPMQHNQEAIGLDIASETGRRIG